MQSRRGRNRSGNDDANKNKTRSLSTFSQPTASLVWILVVGMMAGVGLGHWQRDTDNGGGHCGLGNGGDDNVGLLKALRMVE